MGSQKSSPSNVTLNKIIEIQLSHPCALKFTSKNPCFFVQGVGKGMWSSLLKAMMPMGCPKQKKCPLLQQRFHGKNLFHKSLAFHP